MHPTLLITDPNILPKLQVDKGAIKFVLSGANVMCPGLTSPGAKMDESVPENTTVVSSTYTYMSCCCIHTPCCIDVISLTDYDRLSWLRVKNMQ